MPDLELSQMENSFKIVTKIPLEALWRPDGTVITQRQKSLGRDDIADLLRASPVEFVVADPGLTLRWIPITDAYTFWKDEVKTHLADPSESKWRLEDFPAAFFYSASQWHDFGKSVPIVLLERHH